MEWFLTQIAFPFSFGAWVGVGFVKLVFRLLDLDK